MTNSIYFSLVIPYVPAEKSTQWHPTEKTGPFKTLVRGAFPTEVAAITWAQENLNGTPYTIKEYEKVQAKREIA